LLTDLNFLKYENIMEAKTLGFCWKRQGLPHWKSKRIHLCIEFFVGLALLSLLFLQKLFFLFFLLGFLTQHASVKKKAQEEKMKKKLLTLALVMVLGVGLLGCSSPAADSKKEENASKTETQTQQQVAEFIITLEGIDGKTELTQADLAALPLVEKTIKMTKKDGSETGGFFKGYALKDVAEQLGVTGFTSITMEASDGYSKPYDKATVEAEDSLLTVSLDGEELLSVVAGSLGSSAWVQNISKMSVVK